jgi:hypothetical protein
VADKQRGECCIFAVFVGFLSSVAADRRRFVTVVKNGRRICWPSDLLTDLVNR